MDATALTDMVRSLLHDPRVWLALVIIVFVVVGIMLMLDHARGTGGMNGY